MDGFYDSGLEKGWWWTVWRDGFDSSPEKQAIHPMRTPYEAHTWTQQITWPMFGDRVSCNFTDLLVRSLSRTSALPKIVSPWTMDPKRLSAKTPVCCSSPSSVRNRSLNFEAVVCKLFSVSRRVANCLHTLDHHNQTAKGAMGSALEAQQSVSERQRHCRGQFWRPTT